MLQQFILPNKLFVYFFQSQNLFLHLVSFRDFFLLSMDFTVFFFLFRLLACINLVALLFSKRRLKRAIIFTIQPWRYLQLAHRSFDFNRSMQFLSLFICLKSCHVQKALFNLVNFQYNCTDRHIMINFTKLFVSLNKVKFFLFYLHFQLFNYLHLYWEFNRMMIKQIKQIYNPSSQKNNFFKIFQNTRLLNYLIKYYQITQQQIILLTAMYSVIDYRNAKYQGYLDQNNKRIDMGIVIDDDLTFFASQWKKGQISGNTLIYVAHGKYAYGQWNNNKPHGLNVFRIGDTVLLGIFQYGLIKGRTIVIFQRVNFIAVLNNIDKLDCTILKQGKLNIDLQQCLQFLQINIPDHFLSLVKYIRTFLSPTIQLTSSKENICYFGYKNGLGISFNVKNSIVTIGDHKEGRIQAFGKNYKDGTYVQEGNFKNKEVKKYKQGQRPVKQIYKIYKKMHRTSLFFINEYFCKDINIFNQVQAILRSKIGHIVDICEEHTITLADLNDSLQYHKYWNNQIDKISKIPINDEYDSAKYLAKAIPDKFPKKQKNSLSKDKSKSLKKNSPNTKVTSEKQSLLYRKKDDKKFLGENNSKSKKKSQCKEDKKKKQQQLNMLSQVFRKQKKMTSKTRICQKKQTFFMPITYTNQSLIDSITISPNQNSELIIINGYQRLKENSYQKSEKHYKMIKQQDKYALQEINQSSMLNKSPHRLLNAYDELNQRRQKLLKQFRNIKEQKQIKIIEQNRLNRQPNEKSEDSEKSDYHQPLSMIKTLHGTEKGKSLVNKINSSFGYEIQNIIQLQQEPRQKKEKGKEFFESSFFKINKDLKEQILIKQNMQLMQNNKIFGPERMKKTRKYQYYFD